MKQPDGIEGRYVQVPVGTPLADLPPFQYSGHYTNRGYGARGFRLRDTIVPTEVPRDARNWNSDFLDEQGRIGGEGTVVVFHVPKDYVCAWEEPRANEYGEVAP